LIQVHGLAFGAFDLDFASFFHFRQQPMAKLAAELFEHYGTSLPWVFVPFSYRTRFGEISLYFAGWIC
jgi:hypothetical protein